jgi:multiple sugar transport system permease protein
MRSDRSARTTNLLTLLVLGYAALILFPVAWMATMMVKPEAVMFERPTVWWFTPTLEHFEFVLEAGFHRYVLTSCVVALASTLLVVLIGRPPPMPSPASRCGDATTSSCSSWPRAWRRRSAW